jgi:DNA polymerase (family 10)
MPRSNHAAARMLQEFAELLAIAGGDPFKVRAYERAARVLEGYPRDIDGLDEKALDAIPSIGSHLARKIAEFQRTGSVEELEDLRAQVPAGVRGLLEVPGLGPKRAHQVYEELGVTSVSELLDALHEHRLRHLPGWGERSEENLAQAVRDAHVGGGRIQLAVGLSLAEEILATLSALPEVRVADYAGSIRRMCATVGDVDILVASEDPEPVMEVFCTTNLVSRVLVRGSTKSSVLTTKGVQVDLRVVEPSVWGSAQLYFTGSKSHNIRLREMAVQAGEKLSEYGLFDVGTDELLAAATEQEVYASLGLAWIPPTIREDTGEIEAALSGNLPDLVELADIRGDLHTHTKLTDGVATLEDMVTGAKSRGYDYFAVTDHAPLLYMQRMTDEKALEQREQIRRLERSAGIALLHGTELNIQPDGSLDWPEEFLAGFDIVIASVHSAFRQSRDVMTARILRAVEHPCVNVIAHPTGRSVGRRAPVDADWDEIFRAAARVGTALEVNASPDRLDLDGDLVRRALRAGVRLAVSTDAHAVGHLDNMRFGVATAQRGWAGPGDVINTWPLDKLRRFLAKRPPTRPRAGPGPK